MTAHYRIDPTHSRFTVQAFAAGMFSFLGHNPTFDVRDYDGELWFDPDRPEETRLRVAVRANSLELTDAVGASDRRQIEDAMRNESLETAACPEVAFESDAASAGPPSGDVRPLNIAGRMSLHGVTRPERIDARLTLYKDGVRLAGEFLLRQSDYQIRPVKALGGMLQLKDGVRVSFDVAAWKQDG